MERELNSTRRGFAQVAGAAGLVTLGGLWTPALGAERNKSKKTTGAATSHAVAWRWPSGTGTRSRPGLPSVARRPSGVSMSPGATTFDRMPRRAPSNATWRFKPASAAFVVSYAGMRVPGFSPATDEMRTIAPPPSMTGSAARHKRK